MIVYNTIHLEITLVWPFHLGSVSQLFQIMNTVGIESHIHTTIHNSELNI